MQQSCFLVGFMGCGKSHWGARLSETLGLPLVDLDGFIERNAGKSIPDIFLQDGEAVFRQLERQVLRETALHAPCVVSTGGGAPCFFNNMDWMNAQGATIYLKTPVEILAQRLEQDSLNRPLLQELDKQGLESYIERLLAEREPFYLKAQLVVTFNPDPDVFWETLLDAVINVSFG